MGHQLTLRKGHPVRNRSFPTVFQDEIDYKEHIN